MTWNNNNNNDWTNKAEQFANDVIGADNDILGWDDNISEESEFVQLPPGDYNFTVGAFTRGRFEGSDKMGPCNKAELELKIEYEGRTATVFESLFLHKKAEWKLSEFFVSIGLKEPGQPVRMDWGKVLGATGRCKIYNNEYNGNVYNRVKKFLEPTELNY